MDSVDRADRADSADMFQLWSTDSLWWKLANTLRVSEKSSVHSFGHVAWRWIDSTPFGREPTSYGGSSVPSPKFDDERPTSTSPMTIMAASLARGVLT